MNKRLQRCEEGKDAAFVSRPSPCSPILGGFSPFSLTPDKDCHNAPNKQTLAEAEREGWGDLTADGRRDASVEIPTILSTKV